MPRLRAATAFFRHQASMFLAEPQWLIPNIIAPFVLAMVVLMLYREPSPEAVPYAVLGGGMMGMWGNTLYASGCSIQSDRWWGTMDEIFSVPSPLIWIIGGRTMWNAFIGIVNGLFVVVAAMLIFRTPLEVANFPMFLLAFVLTLLSLAALGVLFSAAFVLTRSAQVLINGLELPIYVGTGSMFPIFLLPYWTPSVSLPGPDMGHRRHPVLGAGPGTRRDSRSAPGGTCSLWRRSRCCTLRPPFGYSRWWTDGPGGRPI